MKKFTFKTDKSTGKYRSFYKDFYNIKFNKKEVGQIVAVDGGYKNRLQVMKENINEDGNPNCDWRWIQLAMKHNSIQDAKEWLNENRELIFKYYNLKK